EGQTIEFHKLSKWVFRFEQILGHFSTDDGHFGLVHHICFIDVPSGHHQGLFYGLMVGMRRLDRVGACFTLVPCRSIGIISPTDVLYIIWKTLPDVLYIIIFELNPSACLKTCIRFRSGPGTNKDGIGGIIIELPHKTVLHTVDRSQEHYQNKYGPPHGKTCQKGPE